MNLVLTAALLAAFSLTLVGPASSGLARAQWVQRAPRAGVVLWQCVGLGAILSGIGAGLALAVNRYKTGFASGGEELVKGILGGRPLQGLGLYDALGLTLAADLAIVLCVVFAATIVRAVRRRARHRKLLDLLTYESPDYPGTEFLADQRTVAYCLPGLRPRIVLSDGTLTLLGRDELWAVIHHERGHAHEHHGLVMLPMVGLRQLFGWIPYARYASTNISLLLEMAADDFSSRRSGRRPLAVALVEMSTTGCAPSCGLAATGSDVATRVTRLLSERSTSKGSAGLAVGLGIGAVVLPLCAAFLA
jgi:Zn-dependent protease with chaperone function